MRMKPPGIGNLQWSEGPLAPACWNDEVHVWQVPLWHRVPTPPVPNLLSADELTRARRFYFERDHVRFVKCRTALRSILSRYVRLPAAEIRFEYQTNGKPAITAVQNPGRLQFSVSHSAQLALIAVSADYRLGIDIEKIRTSADIAALSGQFFSARENASLRSLPQSLQLQGFFACWTRKESFLKATGDGLFFPLSDFTVSTHPEAAPVIEEIRGDTLAGKHWFLADLPVGDGYRATLASEANVPIMETYRWE